MATLTIHNVPARLYEWLATRAAHGRTVAEEALAILEEALNAETDDLTDE